MTIPSFRALRPSWAWALVFGLLFAMLVLVSIGWWQATAVGDQVSVPMFYDAHYLLPRPWTQEQEAPKIPDPDILSALYGPNRVSQSFVSGADRLSLLAIWLSGPAGSPVQLSLSSENGTVYGTEIQLDEVEGRFYFFSIPTVIESRGQEFTLTLYAPEATLENPVSTRTVGGDRLGTSILLNEYSRPGNLEIYTYARGLPGRWWAQALAEQLLPETFALRLQQYKPEIFKGSVFATLLLLTLLLTVLLLILSRPSPIRVSSLVIVGLAGFLIWQLSSGRLRLPLITRPEQLSAQDEPIELAPRPDHQQRLVHDLPLTLWTAKREPEERLVYTGQDEMGRSLISVPANSKIVYPLTVPMNSRLRVGLESPEPEGTRFIVRLGQEELLEQVVVSADGREWIELDLGPWAGQAHTLELTTEGEKDSEINVHWLMPQIMAPGDWLMSYTLATAKIDEPVQGQFVAPGKGRQVELLGFAASAQDAKPGDVVEITLYWQALEQVDAHGTIFVHLLDDSGQVQVQDDSQPVSGTYPMSSWQPGMVIADKHLLRLPLDLPEGSYSLALGIYDPVSLERWEVSQAGNHSSVNGQILVAEAFQVSPGS